MTTPAGLPDSTAPRGVLTESARRSVLAAIAHCRQVQGPLLPILHAVQDALGHVPPAAIPLIAQELNLSRAEVHGVVSFYPHFRPQPTAGHIVYLCRAEACQAMGARALEAHAKRKLGIDFHQTRADGTVTLEPVYCLGNCACAPSLLLDGQLHGRVDAAGFDALIDALGVQA